MNAVDASSRTPVKASAPRARSDGLRIVKTCSIMVCPYSDMHHADALRSNADEAPVVPLAGSIRRCCQGYQPHVSAMELQPAAPVISREFGTQGAAPCEAPCDLRGES